MNNRITLFIVPILSLYIFSVSAQSPAGTYKLRIDLKEKISTSIVKADLFYEVQLLTTDSIFAALPLPFDNNSELSFIIAPESAKNTIFAGYFRSQIGTGAVLIRGSRVSRNFSMAFYNVNLTTIQTTYSQDEYAVNLIIDQSIKLIKENNLNADILQLQELIVNSTRFANSNPTPIMSNGSYEHHIVLPKDFNTENNEVTIYAKIEKKKLPVGLFIFLLFMGSVIGFSTAPKVATTFNKGKIYGIISLLFLIMVPLLTHFFVSPISQLQDYTVLITFGSIMGVGLAIFLYSIYIVAAYIFKKNSP